ncbi:MAG: serine hydrolase domain-containing protein [Actinomycetota bacterium]
MADPHAGTDAAAGSLSLPADLDAILAPIAADFQQRGGQPGVVYGVVHSGSLVHVAGLGERRAGGPVPDADTVFRIASMTKSFTASAVLALRDEGALTLDDPAEAYLPALSGLPAATGDAPPFTIRNLLTMTAGFPTDDPWGDRQQGLPLADFDAALAAGMRFAWAPATRFEYSNLSYAILGRIITAVTGTAYSDFVRARLLKPLGMSATGFEAAEFGADQFAHGYQRGASGWDELEPEGNGAFAPMGGVFSCVRDLARWVSGFAAAFPPGAEGDGGPHPLRRASRREMQLPQLAIPPQGTSRLPAGPDAGSYGFGLFVEDDWVHGRIVQHSGGYPGFGSHMRWHQATGLGVVALANGTYAGAPALGARLLGAILTASANAAGQTLNGAGQTVNAAGTAAAVAGTGQVRGPAPAPGEPWPETMAAQQAVMQLLGSWDDAAAEELFSPNVAWDQPFAARRQDLAQLRERIGDFAKDTGRPAESDSPAHRRWWLRGEHGVAQAEIRLNPEAQPRVQSLTLAVPPAPGGALAGLLCALVDLLNDGARDWPAGITVSAALDTGLLLRQLRMAAGWAGQCQPGAYCSGDGSASAAVELSGETGELVLSVTADPASGQLMQADILLRP